MTLSQNKDSVQVTLSVQWPKDAKPETCKNKLEKILQSWANKNELELNLSVVTVSADGRAVVKIEPAPGTACFFFANIISHVYNQDLMLTNTFEVFYILWRQFSLILCLLSLKLWQTFSN